MIIDSHVHIFSYPSFRDLSKQIRTMEDAIAFRTRYPDLYNCNLTEAPIDSTDDLIAAMRVGWRCAACATRSFET